MWSANQIATVALFRRRWWAHVGGYCDWGLGDQHVPEDWDFWLRLVGHGAFPKNIPEPLMRYRVHDSSLSVDCRRDISLQREQIQRANADLVGQPIPEPVPRYVPDPWLNLYRTSSENSRPAVLFALPFVTIGGGETLMATVARDLAEDGYRVLVATTVALPPSMRDHFQLFEAATPFIYNLPALFDDHRRWKDFFWYLLRAKNIRVILLAGSEYVYRLLPEIRSEFPAVKVVDQLFNDVGHVDSNRRYSNLIHCTVVPSADLAESLTKRHGADPATIRIIPHGVDLLRSLAAPESVGKLASSPPPKEPGQFVVGFFGRMSEEKGPKLFVEIASRLRSVPNIHFYMTGEGPEREAVLDLISRYKICPGRSAVNGADRHPGSAIA
jgi:glycosyltransferase involved in cell wall biosynthesis